MSGFLSTSLSLLKIVCVLAFLGVLFVISGYLAVMWSLSTEEFEMPEVVGLPLAAAQDILTANGLLVEVDEGQLTDDAIPEGHVLRQNPLAGTAIKRQRGIRLTLSSGQPKRQLPMIVGDALPRATIALEQQDVGVEYVSRVYSTEFDKDLVIAQQPNSTELPEGDTVPVRLLVSLGPPPKKYVMPDLVYRNVNEVREYLEALGFRIQERPPNRLDAAQPRGTILRQNPPLGFAVHEGDLIQLVVNIR